MSVNNLVTDLLRFMRPADSSARIYLAADSMPARRGAISGTTIPRASSHDLRRISNALPPYERSPLPDGASGGPAPLPDGASGGPAPLPDGASGGPAPLPDGASGGPAPLPDGASGNPSAVLDTGSQKGQPGYSAKLVPNPTPGVQERIAPDDCSYSYSLDKAPGHARQIIENHHIGRLASDTEPCDVDCKNITISQLWESLFIKLCLEDPGLSARIVNVHRRVFAKYAERFPDEYQLAMKEWLVADSKFPVNQKDRDWSAATMSSEATQNFVLQDVAGINHDPTSIVLSADFLKYLAFHLVEEPVKTIRNEYNKNIQNRVRGFRTNQGRRFDADGKDYIKESQVGIVDFDIDNLELDSRYFKTTPWLHWGRSACDTSVKQGAYQFSVGRLAVPEVCGLSGSTNFWVWTALSGKVDLTEDEVRLLLLSAYLTLGSDGGHSLMEVLSSATVTAIYWRLYTTHSTKRDLIPYLTEANFAQNLYSVTKDINPIGTLDKKMSSEMIEESKRMMFLDTRDGDDIYFVETFGKKKEQPENALRRERLEQVFSDDRHHLPFASYGSFLDKIPGLDRIRRETIEALKRYKKRYC